jgi:FkbM family methyltransferase
MKSRIKLVLQRILGLDNYLFLFAIFRVFASRLDKRESGLFQFIKLLPENAVVLDIGANIGVTGTIIKQQLPSATLIAFEPLPLNLRTLRAAFKLFDVEATVVPFAVGDKSKTTEMMLPRKDGVVLHGLGHLSTGQQNSDGIVVPVEMIRVDDCGHLWGNARVAGVKLDVENAESLVLAGARELLRRDRPLVYCELWDNDNRRKCIEIAEELGYTVNVFSNGELQLFDSSKHLAEDFLLLPPSSSAASHESPFRDTPAAVSA